MDVVIASDSSSALAISNRVGLGTKTKHIDIRALFVQDLIKKKIIRTRKVHTSMNNSDALTKALDARTLWKHVKASGFELGVKLNTGHKKVSRELINALEIWSTKTIAG